MPQEKGHKLQHNWYEEAVYGTAPAINGVVMPVVNVNLQMTQPLISTDVLRANRNPVMPTLDEKTVAGSITLQPDARSIGWILKHLLGAPVTTGAGPFTHTFKAGNAMPIGLTMENWFSGVAQSFRHLGSKPNRFTFDVATGGYLSISLDVIGSEATTAGTRLGAAPLAYAVVPFRVPTVTMAEGGGAYAKATRFSMTVDNMMEPIRTIGGGGKVTSINEGIYRITGSMTIIFEDLTMYNKAVNNTETSLAMTFPSGAHSLVFTAPEAFYQVSSPQAAGPAGVFANLDFVAFSDDHADATALKAVLINDVTSYAAMA